MKNNRNINFKDLEFLSNLKRRGFTLVEILVVIAIIGVLTTAAVAAVNIARNKAKIAKAQHDIDTLYTALSNLGNDTNQWHQNLAINQVGTNVKICGPDITGATCPTDLTSSSTGLLANNVAFASWNGPYMVSIPVDAWGYQYFFDDNYSVTLDGRPCQCDPAGCINAAVLGSYGPDSKYGTCDDVIKIMAHQ
jgi:prepilin-type N-terminal cleavage/methylation domain-containing protein